MTDNIKCYRQSEEDVFSVYVAAAKALTEEEAIALLEKENITDLEYIGEDESVTSYIGFNYCLIFHSNSN